MNSLELLAPAGDLEKLKAAVIYGADAVYLGGKQFSLRAGAGNFGPEELAEGVKFAHRYGAKVYAAVNIFAHNRDLEALPEYLSYLEDLNIDGVIVSDPGVLLIIQERNRGIPVHLSTQANTTNYASALFWKKQGVKRIVLARELSLEEIKKISQHVNVELEAFVHGAMCMAYSGRCLLSSYLTGRDANRGDCAQPCRWKYYLVEEKRPGQYFPVIEEERGTYFMSSRDLCLIEYIPHLVNAGVTSFKIEGRMKSVHYVSTVVKSYRQAIDKYLKDPKNYAVEKKWVEEISKVSHRDYTTGFIFGRPGEEAQSDKPSQYRRDYRFVGIVRHYDKDKGMAVVEQRNNFVVGDKIEVSQPRGENLTFTVQSIYNEEGQQQENAPHPQQILYIPMPPVEPWSMMRQVVK
ncbi:MAG: U32 family peptidase [Desulfotomaculum sp.]|nr:U32 family peptidase [Desulfotomaculum sp.]